MTRPFLFLRRKLSSYEAVLLFLRRHTSPDTASPSAPNVERSGAAVLDRRIMGGGVAATVAAGASLGALARESARAIARAESTRIAYARYATGNTAT